MKKQAAFIVLIALLTLTGVGAVTTSFAADQDKPGDAVKAFARAMEANNPKKVGEIVPQLKDLLSEEKLKTMVEQASKEIKSEGGIKAITVDKEKIDGDKAKVTATLENGNGDKETEEFELRKKDGKWTIYIELEGKPQPGQ